jgi:hypothetical protein
LRGGFSAKKISHLTSSASADGSATIDDGATPNTQLIHHAYAAAPLIFEVRGLPVKAGREPMDSLLGVSVGNVIHCEHGFLLLSIAGSIAAYDQSGRLLRTFTGIYQNHHANFVKAIRSRQARDLTADISEGHISSSLCHVANISHRLGQQATQAEIRERIKGDKDCAEAYERMLAHLEANGVDTRKDRLILGEALSLELKTHRFVNNERANALQTRSYRAPFDL